MYAPNPYESGSSVSHWSTSLYPNEIMEPFLTSGSATRAIHLVDLLDASYAVEAESRAR